MPSFPATIEPRPSAPKTQRPAISRPSSRTTPRTGSSSVPAPIRSTARAPKMPVAPTASAVSTAGLVEDDPPRREAQVESLDRGVPAGDLMPQRDQPVRDELRARARLAAGRARRGGPGGPACWDRSGALRRWCSERCRGRSARRPTLAPRGRSRASNQRIVAPTMIASCSSIAERPYSGDPAACVRLLRGLSRAGGPSCDGRAPRRGSSRRRPSPSPPRAAGGPRRRPP